MARCYADENFPGPIVQRVQELGHDVLTARDDGRANRRIPDADVLARAEELGRAVLTNDRDDYHKLHHASPEHASIITCTRDPDFLAVADRIHAAIAPHPDLAGRLFRVIRPIPPSPRVP